MDSLLNSNINNGIFSTPIVVALISATVVLTVGIMTWIQHRTFIKEQRRAEKRIRTTQKLDEFYGPMISYLNVIKALRRIFGANKPREFRILTFLIDPNQSYKTENGPVRVILNETDHYLLKEIIEIEKHIEKLILNKGGLVEDDALMFDYLPDPTVTDVQARNISLLALAITHFRVLRMAYEGRLVGDLTRFEDFVYPRELDMLLRERTESLRRELNTL